MTILQRYVAKTVLVSTLLVIVVVSALAFFINLLGELRDIGVGDYGFIQALIHVALRLPSNVYQLFPMLVLVGGVMGLGLLASSRELIVMRASGVSVLSLVKSVMLAALVLIFFATLIGEGLVPEANFLADKRKDSAQNGGQAVATKSGVWVHEGNNFLHIDRVNGLEHLEGVTRYEFNNQHQLINAYFAKQVDYSQNQWQAQDTSVTHFEKDKTSSMQVAASVWSLNLNPNLLNVGIIEPEQMSLSSLSRYTRHLVKNKLQAETFQFEFWKRVFQPLTTLVMILLAIPFVFGSPRSVAMGLRILIGVIIGFVFYILNALLGQLSVVFQMSPFFAAVLPLLLFSALGYFLMLRVR